MNHNLKKLIYPFYSILNNNSMVKKMKINFYKKNGKVPWSFGYLDYRFQEIEKNINDSSLLTKLKNGKLDAPFGYKLDERTIEYPWIFSRMSKDSKKMLDAGSTFNFKFVLEHEYIKSAHLNIYTFYPETPSFKSYKNVTYDYGDLRKMQYENESFDQVISQSTIEHIDMDNNIYGYDLEKIENVKLKSYEYLIAVKEMERVLKPKGNFLLTFPFGIFKNYGFFQQFDSEMVERITSYLAERGDVKTEYALYKKDTWQMAEEKDCLNSTSFNPHTGEDKGDDGAAHCRSVCLIQFTKA